MASFRAAVRVAGPVRAQVIHRVEIGCCVTRGVFVHLCGVEGMARGVSWAAVARACQDSRVVKREA